MSLFQCGSPVRHSPGVGHGAWGFPALGMVTVPQGCQHLLWHEGSPTEHVSIPSWLPVSFPNTFDLGTMHFPAHLTPLQGFDGWWLFPGARAVIPRCQLQPRPVPTGPAAAPRETSSLVPLGRFSLKPPAQTARELQGSPQDLWGQDMVAARNKRRPGESRG